MNTFRTILMSGFLLLGLQTFAQNQNRTLGLNVDISPLQIKDYFHSDYTYRGTGLGMRVFYQQERLKTRWQMEAAYSQANPQSLVSRKAATRFVDVGFNYLWRLSAANKPENRFQFFGGFGLRLFNTTTNYSPDINVSTKLTTAAAAVGGSVALDYRITARQRIQAQLFAPVISAFYRPNYLYAGRDQVTTSLVGINAVFDGQMRYLYQVSRQFQVNVSYQFNYVRTEQPRSIIGLRQTIGVGVQYSF